VDDVAMGMTEVEGVLARLGVGPHTLTDNQRLALDAEGYLVLPGVLNATQVAAVMAVIDARLSAARRDASWTPGGTLHLDDLTGGGPAVDAVWTNPRVLAAVAHVLGPDLRLARVHFRGPQPGHGAQHLHADTAAALGPDEGDRGATVILALVDFTERNGATRVIPGSHTPEASRHTAETVGPRAVRKHKIAPADHHPGQRVVTCPAGSAIVFTEQLWHSGTRNDSDHVRASLQISFYRADVIGRMGGAPAIGNEALDRLGDAALLLI
jgi:ectoine hydroxylase-related dioxygenase (phytanoyl-CoA dioxygenase family)